MAELTPITQILSGMIPHSDLHSWTDLPIPTKHLQSLGRGGYLQLKRPLNSWDMHEKSMDKPLDYLGVSHVQTPDHHVGYMYIYICIYIYVYISICI